MRASLAKGLFDAPRPMQTAPTAHIFTGLFSELSTAVRDSACRDVDRITAQREQRIGQTFGAPRQPPTLTRAHGGSSTWLRLLDSLARSCVSSPRLELPAMRTSWRRVGAPSH